ncbi:MAG: alpha/beta hydrolase [Lachnospiraceae bacterium]|nr:alpha/beta hydrolase [uncultured Acetatifactor sp.]MCI8287156.1 alpha/beta hydrolase [Lachnospiraceae bacterium]
MQYFKLDVKQSHSMEYAACNIYLIDDSKEITIKTRPMVIVCPGGAYAYTSDREAEIVALQFLSMGYHASVLKYSTAPAVFPTSAFELGSAVLQIRSHAGEWNINPNQLVVTGFSAGGHLAASYCMFWNQKWMAEGLNTETELLRPNGMILGYPVITSGEYAHKGSFQNLLGAEYESKKAMLSLENCVGEQVPRTFLWHTCEDQSVPVQNSLLLANALVSNRIPVEFHLFEKGGHGLSLANRLTNTQGHGPECAAGTWIPLVHQWMENWLAVQDA